MRVTLHTMLVLVRSLPCLLSLLVILAGPACLMAQNLETIGQRSPLLLNGSVSLRTVFYGANDLSDRRESFSYVLSGSLNANFYELALPFSYTLSEQDRSFSQPFNQFGLSPRYKWITAHLGFRNLNLSRFTLAGHQMFGAGVELNPGHFRLALMYGQLNRAVQQDTTAEHLQIPAYERSGFGGRLGFGSELNHVDLLFLKAVDDTNSIRRPSSESGIRPGENLVLGLKARFEIIDGLNVFMDAAVSDYTRDIRSDPLDDDNDVVAALSGIITPRTSTQIYSALNTGFNARIDKFNLKADYTRIDPDYQSMGAYYMANDLEQINIAPSIALLDYKLRINAALNYQHDNLQDKKRATTTRVAPRLNVSFAPNSSFGVDLQVGDMLTTQADGTQRLNDTLRMDQRNPTVTLTPRYVIIDTTLTHTFFLTLMYQELVDNNSFTSEFSEYDNSNLNFSYALAFVRESLNLSASVSVARLNNFGGEFTNSGFSLGAEKALMDNTLNLNSSLSAAFQDFGSTTSLGLGGNYVLAEQHNFNLNFSLTTSSVDSGNDNQSFSEYTAVAGYVFTF